MSQGIAFTLNHPQARLLWAKELQRAIPKQSWFMQSGFVGKDPLTNVIVEMDDLEKGAGARVRYSLRSMMRGPAVAGDNTLQGQEGSLDFLGDDLFVNQIRNGLKSRGKMSEQYVPYDLRSEMRDAQGDYWGVFHDEQIIAKLCGTLGVGVWETVNTSVFGRDINGAVDFDGNTLRAPTSNRLITVNGSSSSTGATSGTAAALTANDRFSLDAVDLALKVATRMDANTVTRRKLQPLKIKGKKVFVCLLDLVQAFDLKANTGGRWYDIEKARLQGSFKDSNLVQQSLGVYESAAGSVLFFSHEGMPKFNTYGAGSNIKAARAVLMGQCAGVIAYGRESAGSKQRYYWHEELDDRGNQLVVDSGMVLGVQKCSYEVTAGTNGALNTNREDFGVIAIDTAAAW